MVIGPRRRAEGTAETMYSSWAVNFKPATGSSCHIGTPKLPGAYHWKYYQYQAQAAAITSEDGRPDKQMRSIKKFTTDPDQCVYLPDQTWQLEYNVIEDISVIEYMQLIRQGWRKFGYALFRPSCPSCKACQSIRVPVSSFKPSRSQARSLAANQDLRAKVCHAAPDEEEVLLCIRHHHARANTLGWAQPTFESVYSIIASFSSNPLPIAKRSYFLADNVVAVLFADELPDGLSAVYSFYDPELSSRCLGTYMILDLIAEAASRQLGYVYLGYYIAGCRSMSYKERFAPNEVLGEDGQWRLFRQR